MGVLGTLCFFLFGCAVVAGIGALIIYGHTSKYRAQERVLRAFVEERGGRLLPATPGLFGIRGPCAVDVDVGQVRMCIDTHQVAHGKSSITYTRVRAAGRMPGYPVYRVHSEGLLAPLARTLGFQDVEVGDPAFDAAFTVKADDEGLVREVWFDRARDVMLREFRKDAAAWSDGRRITLHWMGLETQTRRFDAAIDLVANLARAGEWLLNPLKALPGATPIPPTELAAWDFASVPGVDVDVEGTVIRIQPELRERALGLVAHLLTRDPQPRYISAIAADATATPPIPSEVLPPDLGQFLEGIGPATVACGGKTVAVHWAGIPDVARVQAALRLLPKLTGRAPVQGAFR